MHKENFADSSSILLIFAIFSFLPQILRIRSKQTTSGVSSHYVLWNLICATEQLAIFIFLLFNAYDPEGGTIFLHTPPSAGDWFGLCHCAVVTILFLTLFVQVLLYSNRRVFLIASYISFLLVSIVPLIIDAIAPFDVEGPPWFFAFYFALQSMLLYQVTTALVILGIYRQAREILTVPFPNALSLQSLAAQATVFILITVTWLWSLPFPWEEWDGIVDWHRFSIWYGATGWVVIDNFFFAFGQVLLLILALCRLSSHKATMQQGDETEPLLGQPRQ
ncbi:hypothetical protein N7523_002906 [Penicillium sp. IBT 18751x]|nr:hypothetical protein N7523_002906 [Penicillium sp. IBT 18751x]